jgi:hypothetical protein
VPVAGVDSSLPAEVSEAGAVVNDFYTFDQISTLFVRKAAAYVGHRYRLYMVEPDDVAQEIYVWLYGDGKDKVEKYLDRRPQQTTRIYRSMLDKAIIFAEREKAEHVGYHPDDVYWYTVSSIEGLMPLVLDPTYTQENGHVGELLTMVVDIRQAMHRADVDYFLEHDDTDPLWRESVQSLVDRLGGNRPYIGRRRILTNAQAVALTHGEVE